MSWSVDLVVPEQWSVISHDDVHLVEIRFGDGSEAPVIGIGVLEVGDDADLNGLEADLDVFATDWPDLLMSRTVDRGRPGGRDLLTVLDVTRARGVAPDATGALVSQNFCGFLRDRRAGAVVRFEVRTSSMNHAAEIAEASTAVLESVRLVEVSDG